MSVDDTTAPSTVAASRTIVLVIAERDRHDGKYSARHNDELIVDGVKEPFLEAARVLLAQGLDPAARYVMRRSADGPDALVSTLGTAAKLTVDEYGTPRFRQWQPNSFRGPAEVEPTPVDHVLEVEGHQDANRS